MARRYATTEDLQRVEGKVDCVVESVTDVKDNHLGHLKAAVAELQGQMKAIDRFMWPIVVGVFLTVAGAALGLVGAYCGWW